jgi:DNA-binding NarL/FixJ family response regulator
MRVILVGPAEARARAQAGASAAGLTIVGEAATLAEARTLALDADALLVVPAGGSPDEEEQLVEALTQRERDVLALLAEGLSNKAIADRLGISDQTVKFHVASIYGKLGASNRTDAVRRAYRRGLIAL